MALSAMGTVQLSQAAPITVNFSAVVTVTEVGAPDVGSTIQGSVTLGDVPSSSTFWPSPADCPTSNCSVEADFLFDTAPSQFRVDFGGKVITSSSVVLMLSENTLFLDNPDRPIEFVQGDLLFLGTKVNGRTYTLGWLMRDDQALSGVSLSDGISLLSQMPQGGMFSSFEPGASPLGLQARVTSLSVTTVPEPSTAILLALGLGGAMTVATRRRHASHAHQAVNEA